MSGLQRIALGERPADLVVRDGRVFVAEAEEFVCADVLVGVDRIAGLVPDSDGWVGPNTDVIDAEGRTVAPGFVDGHTHLDEFQTFERSFPRALVGGTTSVVTESDRFAKRHGADGIRELLAATADIPVGVFVMLPPGLFLGEQLTGHDLDRIVELASEPRVVGVGEVIWSLVVGVDSAEPVAALLEAVRAEGGTVSGHGAGCHDERLTAFAAVVDDDHEILTPDDVSPRVRRGITPIGRYGSIRDDIDAFVAGVRELPAADPCLCSDGMWPADLVGEGYMDRVVARAIEAGLKPSRAYRMATLNTAEHFGLDDRGSLSPGSMADVVILEDPELVTVDTVLAAGSVVVKGGEPLVSPRPHQYPSAFRRTVDLDLEPGRFRVDAPESEEVRAIDYETGLLSRETFIEPPVEDGELRADAAGGVLKASLLATSPGRRGLGFTGLVTGLGLETGAMATSDTWGEPGLLVIGVDGTEMHRAARRVVDIGGGWVVVRDDEPVAELPTPIAGVCAETPVETTAERLEEVRAELASQGMTAEQPLLAVGTLTATEMPWIKLSVEGYLDVVNRSRRGLVP